MAAVSTQMDAAEAVSMFKGARALNDAMSGAAAQQQALFSKEAAKAQAAFIEQIDPQDKGKYAGAVGGQAALKAAGARASWMHRSRSRSSARRSC
jgi:type VI secretion system secreted protein VgrG